MCSKCKQLFQNPFDHKVFCKLHCSHTNFLRTYNYIVRTEVVGSEVWASDTYSQLTMYKVPCSNNSEWFSSLSHVWSPPCPTSQLIHVDHFHPSYQTCYQESHCFFLFHFLTCHMEGLDQKYRIELQLFGTLPPHYIEILISSSMTHTEHHKLKDLHCSVSFDNQLIWLGITLEIGNHSHNLVTVDFSDTTHKIHPKYVHSNWFTWSLKFLNWFETNIDFILSFKTTAHDISLLLSHPPCNVSREH